MRFRDKQPSANKSVNIFLALKVSKIFVALILTTIYLTVIKTEVKQFILCFAGIYMIYLIFDTAFLLHSEQIAKRNKTKE
jgi:hypothetical protein